MARKKIREYDSKRLLKAHLQQLAQISLPLNVAQANPTTDSSVHPQVLHSCKQSMKETSARDWQATSGRHLVVYEKILTCRSLRRPTSQSSWTPTPG